MANANGDNIGSLLIYLQWAETFPDFPKNFTFPSLTDPNYVPPYNGQSIIISNWILMPLALLLVIARLAARTFRGQRRLGWDDWVIIPATISTLAYNIFMTLVVGRGCVGYHIYDCYSTALEYGFKYKYAGLLIYVLSATLIKLSIGLFCLRLAPVSARAYRWTVIGVNVAIIVVFLGSFPSAAVNCFPVRAAWDLSVAILPTTHCQSQWRLVVGWGTIYAVLDIILIILPIYLVLDLSLRKRAKAGLALIFSFAGTAVIASLYKLSVTKKAYDTYDQSWYV
jgi:hypothetical protein